MTIELYFTMALGVFVLIAACISMEHFIAARWLKKDSILVRLLKGFERRHPSLCDNEDAFYCFFKRDSFSKH